MSEYKYLGDRPYGLMPDPNDPRKTVKNYDEIAQIDLICHRYRQGDSMRAVVRWMNGEKIMNRSGKPWHIEQIRRILKREGLLDSPAE